jgi:hypothetical protein
MKNAQNCPGGLLVFPHMPLFQLDLNSQPNGRDAIYWFDFISQKNVKTANSYIKKNPPASFAIVDVPEFVWEAHMKAFNRGNTYAQENLIGTLLDNATHGYSSSNYKLYKNSDDYSITVYTRDSCKVKR